MPRRVRARAVERSGISALGVQARNNRIIFHGGVYVVKNTSQAASVNFAAISGKVGAQQTAILSNKNGFSIFC